MRLGQLPEESEITKSDCIEQTIQQPTVQGMLAAMTYRASATSQVGQVLNHFFEPQKWCWGGGAPLIMHPCSLVKLHRNHLT